MSLSVLADTADLIAAIGVIVSLVYLAVQVKHANALAKANAYREIHEDIGSILADISKDPELHRV